MLGTSLAVARAAAASLSLPLFRYLGGPSAATLPVPMMNVINGGKHAEGALQFQECMIVPLGARERGAKRCAAAPKSFTRSESCCTTGHLPTLVGDEGGYAPPLETPHQALDLIRRRDRTSPATKPATTLRSRSIRPRASSTKTASTTRSTSDRGLSADEMIALYRELCDRYPIVSIEDGLAEDDWDGWRKLTQALGRPRAARRRRSLRHQRERFSSAASPKACGNSILDQGQPDRHAHRNARRLELAHKAGFTHRDLAPLRRNRRYDDRRSRGRDRRRPDQDRIAFAQRPDREV